MLTLDIGVPSTTTINRRILVLSRAQERFSTCPLKDYPLCFSTHCNSNCQLGFMPLFCRDNTRATQKNNHRRPNIPPKTTKAETRRHRLLLRLRKFYCQASLHEYCSCKHSTFNGRSGNCASCSRASLLSQRLFIPLQELLDLGC
jgi:hypothetical protein